MINHDLRTLYTIARTFLPKDILDALIYGDFEDATAQELADALQLAQANEKRFRKHSAKEITKEEETGTADGLWFEEDYYNGIFE